MDGTMIANAEQQHLGGWRQEVDVTISADTINQPLWKKKGSQHIIQF